MAHYLPQMSRALLRERFTTEAQRSRREDEDRQQTRNMIFTRAESQRRGGHEKTKQLFTVNLCASASQREIISCMFCLSMSVLCASVPLCLCGESFSVLQ